jgi:hypothetical protein
MTNILIHYNNKKENIFYIANDEKEALTKIKEFKKNNFLVYQCKYTNNKKRIINLL